MSTGQRDQDQTREVSSRLWELAEVTSCLPRQLRELSAELQAWQSAAAFDDGTRDPGGPDNPITAARYALSEATTAALALDRRISDAARHMAAVFGGRVPDEALRLAD